MTFAPSMPRGSTHPVDDFLTFIDGVVQASNIPIRFVEEGIHGVQMTDSHHEHQGLVGAPVEVRMEDGFKLGCHMLSKIRHIHMFETQDDNLRGSILNAFNFESEKVFEVVDLETDYPAMVVQESSNCFERNCMMSKCRPIRFSILARASPTVLLPAAQLNKGFSCSFVNKMMRVTSHDGRTVLGYIEPKWHCCHIHFRVLDERRREIFSIEGQKWQLSSILGKLPIPGLKRVIFNANGPQGDAQGMIANEWSGFCREFLGDSDDYTLQYFNPDMSPHHRLLMLATAFYLDMRYFSSCCSFTIRDCIIKRYTPKHIAKAAKYAPVALQGAKGNKKGKNDVSEAQGQTVNDSKKYH